MLRYHRILTEMLDHIDELMLAREASLVADETDKRLAELPGQDRRKIDNEIQKMAQALSQVAAAAQGKP